MILYHSTRDVDLCWLCFLHNQRWPRGSDNDRLSVLGDNPPAPLVGRAWRYLEAPGDVDW